MNDFDFFVGIAEHIKSEFEQDRLAWKDSQFEWVLQIPSGAKGKLGKRLVASWCAAKGLSVDASPDSDADILINGHRVEIKFSTLWKTGVYKFQQIRDQNYEYLVALGISPSTAHCWVVPKKLLHKYVIGLTPQHKGSQGVDTFWFEVRPANPPQWLLGQGGSLDQAYQILRLIRKS